MLSHYTKLCGRIYEICGSKREFAKQMGLSKATISAKLNGKSEFTRGEMEKAANILHIAMEDLHKYFFVSVV